MWSQVTESLTNIAVTLGADVNISCDLDIKEIYWYKQKLPDPPVSILRTFDSMYEKAKYENSIFKHKYSVKTNSRLFIRNISTDELGVYYCVKTSEPQKFSNGTKIYITDSVHMNQTETNDAPQQQTPWSFVTITSVLLNVLLIIALIGPDSSDSLFTWLKMAEVLSEKPRSDFLSSLTRCLNDHSIEDSSGSDDEDHTASHLYIYHNQQQTPWRTVTIITSVLLNVLLIIAFIGLVKSYTDVTGISKNDTAAQNSNNLLCIQVTRLKMAEVLSDKPSSDFISSLCLNDHSIEDIQHLTEPCFFRFNGLLNVFFSLIDLLMWSQVTESLTNIAVTLGADVIISCDLDIKDIYWYKQKLPDPPVLMLRTYSSRSEGAKYENSTFEDKYSVKTNSRLFIRNISTDELGVYYCVKTSEPLKFSSGTKIYITDSVYMNQTESDDASQQQTPWRTVTITSVLLNVLLIIALIVMVKSYIDITGRSKNFTDAKISNNLQVTGLKMAKKVYQRSPALTSSLVCVLEVSDCFHSQLEVNICSCGLKSTNIAVTLGADVNISCDLDIKEIYWYKLKSLNPPVNISTDELGVYYCVKTSEPLKFSNDTKIYISDSVNRIHTESDDAPQHEIPWSNLTIITLVLLNVLLTIALIGLFSFYQKYVQVSLN
ncbi:Ig kappa chain V-III region [Labeo rohita]|uniref:Ig kappa chain V-III region n=1 Tax=Labeo rohita TaxID=84645 RepID=A0ABQ8LHS0_LABRO|nr:Ig kappa chain V-III region [Labeo rohita]